MMAITFCHCKVRNANLDGNFVISQSVFQIISNSHQILFAKVEKYRLSRSPWTLANGELCDYLELTAESYLIQFMQVNFNIFLTV